MASSSKREQDSNQRTRSRSPHSATHQSKSSRKRSRSRERDRHHDTQKRAAVALRAKPLPYKAQELRKRDLETYNNLFALYLDVQKQLDLSALKESEVKGRWKSFLKKWNEGDLAEGWYDPSTKRKADEQAEVYEHEAHPADTVQSQRLMADDEDEDEEVGPALPGHAASTSRSGPAIPNGHELRYRDEMVAAHYSDARKRLQYERKLDMQQQKERLDELVPRAQPGTRERQLEKKRDAAAARADFRAARSPGADDVRETDLMGGNEDGVDAYKRKKMEEEKRKTERQIRKEEIWRAKAEERKEKLAEMKAKEDKTMDMLKGLARQRFG